MPPRTPGAPRTPRCLQDASRCLLPGASCQKIGGFGEISFLHEWCLEWRSGADIWCIRLRIVSRNFFIFKKRGEFADEASPSCSSLQKVGPKENVGLRPPKIRKKGRKKTVLRMTWRSRQNYRTPGGIIFKLVRRPQRPYRPKPFCLVDFI